MNDVLYKVVFEGDLLPGYEQATVQKKLAKLFNINVAMAGRLFIGKQREIKRDLTLNQAKRYVIEMSKLGVMVFMLPLEEDETLVPIPADSVEITDSESFRANAFSAYFEKKEAKKQQKNAAMQQEAPQIFVEQEWDEISGERKVRDIEKIARQILQQRHN